MASRPRCWTGPAPTIRCLCTLQYHGRGTGTDRGLCLAPDHSLFPGLSPGLSTSIGLADPGLSTATGLGGPGLNLFVDRDLSTSTGLDRGPCRGRHPDLVNASAFRGRCLCCAFRLPDPLLAPNRSARPSRHCLVYAPFRRLPGRIRLPARPVRPSTRHPACQKRHVPQTMDYALWSGAREPSELRGLSQERKDRNTQ